jgi:VWFA-related protein
MRTLSAAFLTISVALAIPAPQTAQEPLPSAPSATKYPVPQAKEPGTQQPASTQEHAPATTAPSSQESTPAQAPANPPTTQATPASQAPSSKPAASDDQDEKLTTIVKQVDEVNVVFTVTDKRSKFVTDLKKEDFQVMDDKKPAPIRSFRAETNLPLRVGLLIDASNSIRDRFKFEQDAAIEFLNQIVHLQDQAFVLGFDTTPEVTQNFTNNTEALAKGVRMLRPGGGTALYDAVYYAARDEIMAKDKSTTATRRAIILLSDGDDNQSRVSRDEAVEMAQKAEVIIYTISTNTSGTKQKGDKVLEYFAEKTGGRAFFPFRIQDVSDAFSQI